MSLRTGSRLGAYEVLAPIGAGGMGEVYRAHDTKLGRDVALKVLPDAFVNDRERLARFEREARTLAALNHPNIAAIYGIEGNALVMELVEGDDLSRRVEAGPIPLAEALPMARQIASALEAAHEAGIVHRDLKPANIKVREDGTVKVLDFGLAKATEHRGGSGSRPANGLHSGAARTGQASESESTVLSPAMTTMGMIVGTAAYMAPEQAKGRHADRRADVWAFGVVLYEMLTGRRLFVGSDVSETLAAVLTAEPKWQALPATTPPIVRQLLKRCLAKDQRLRLDSLAAARLDIEDAITGPGAPASAPSPPARLVPVAWLVGGLLAGVLASYLIWSPAKLDSSSSSGPVVSAITPTSEVLSAFTYGFALSPDAATLVYAARTADGQRRLWKRRLADPRAEMMPSTEDAAYPFWSPDGRDVGFFAAGVLKRVPIAGGPVQTVALTPGSWPYGTWNERGEILFSVGATRGAGIFRVTSSGGTPERLPIPRNVTNPEWLPDGRHFLFIDTDASPIGAFVGSVDTTEPPVRVMDTPDLVYSSGGFVLFNHAGVLSLQRFNTTSFKVEGPILPLGDRAGTPRGWFAARSVGSVVIALNPRVDGDSTPGDPVSRLRWFDRKGNVLGQVGAPARYWTMHLSHDDTRVTVNPGDTLWAIDTRTSVRTRLAPDATGAVWMPDDSAIILRTERGLSILAPTGEGSGREFVAFQNRVLLPTDVSPDSKTLLVTARAGADARSLDVMLVTIEDGSIRPLMTSEFDESQASFSPEGKWIAYTANPSGRPEIYVRPLSGGAPIQVSIDGGEHAFWRQKTRELFFLSPTDEVVAVDVSDLERTKLPGARRVLFRQVTNDVIRESFTPYAVSADGQRFLLNVPEPPEPLTLIQRVSIFR
jgi:serine/threonine protein kinase